MLLPTKAQARLAASNRVELFMPETCQNALVTNMNVVCERGAARCLGRKCRSAHNLPPGERIVQQDLRLHRACNLNSKVAIQANKS